MLQPHTRQDDVSPDQTAVKARALRFVLLVGVMSLFSDFTYEGSRSIVGPYMATLGAGALAVGVTAGFGELLGYSFRLVSGRMSDRTGQFWPITIVGYVVQMSAVPLLAVAGTWQLAAVLVVLERLGKATRNPPRDVMLSHAGGEIGYGWAFSLHEALDQSGAMIGPLAVSAVLAIHGKYETAFAFLAIPALLTLSILAIARLTYPRPHELESHPPEVGRHGLVRAYWLYVVAAAQVGSPLPGRPSYGHSLIVDPWGIVLAEAPDSETVISAELDRGRLRDIRAKLPSLANRQPDAYRWPAPA